MEKNHFNSKVVPTLVSSIFYSNDIFDEEAYLQICAFGFHKVMQNGSVKDLKNYIITTDTELCPKSYGRAQLVALVSTSKPDNFKWFCKEAEIDMETELSIGSSSSISNTQVELTLIADLLN